MNFRRIGIVLVIMMLSGAGKMRASRQRKVIYVLLALFAINLLLFSPVFAVQVISSIPTNDSHYQDISTLGPGGGAIGTCFTSGVSTSLTTVSVDLSKASGSSGNIVAQLFSTSGSPSGGDCTTLNVLLATSGSVTIASIPTAPTFAATIFTFASGSVVSGHSYIIAIQAIDGANQVFVRIADNNNVVAANTFMFEDSLGTSGNFASTGDQNACLSANSCMAFTLYGANAAPPTLCSQTNSGLIFAGSGFVVIMAMIAGVVLLRAEGGSASSFAGKFSRRKDGDDANKALMVVVMLVAGMLISLIVLSAAPGFGC